MRARRGFVIDADLAEANPARKTLEKAVALRQLPQRRGCPRRQQAEVAGICGDFLPRAPVDQGVEAAPGKPAQCRFVVAMGFGGIDHVVAVIDPVSDQFLDQIGRVLAVAVHEHHGAAPGVIEPRHQRRFLAEIARQRHHLDIERVCRKAARDAERGVGAAVIDVDHLAGKAVALPERGRQRAEPLMQQCEAGRLVVKRHDDRQSLRGCGYRVGGQARYVTTQRHRSGPNIPKQHTATDRNNIG